MELYSEQFAMQGRISDDTLAERIRAKLASYQKTATVIAQFQAREPEADYNPEPAKYKKLVEVDWLG